MRNRFNFRDSNLRIFLTAVLVMTCIMLYSIGTGGRSDFVSSIAGIITEPVQRVSAMISAGFGSFSGNFDDIEQIRAENELLKKKVREMNRKTVDYNDLKAENEQYRKLLGLKEENDMYEFLASTVISRDGNDYYAGFTLDKGSADGVELYDPVITADGLVGYISGIGVTSSKVTTILSPGLEVGAVDKDTRDGGTLFGEISTAKEGCTRLNYLSRDCDVTVGDIVVTSGFGSVFPANLIIGNVKEIRAESENISLYAVVEPTADVKGCTDVFIITEFEGQRSVRKDSIEGYRTTDETTASKD